MAYNFSTGGKVELELLDRKTDEELKLKSILESSDDENEVFVIHAPIHESRIYVIQNGAKLKLYFSSTGLADQRYDVYSFFGTVISREIRDNIPMLKVRRSSEITKIQRRDYFRLNYVREMDVLKVDNEETIEITSRDISLGGMRFLSNHYFEAEEKIICNINFEDEEMIAVNGNVIVSDSTEDVGFKYEVRVQFEKVSQEIRTTIARWINFLQAEYIKKVSSETYERNLKQIMPQFNAEKLEHYDEERKFKRRLGYVKGLVALGMIILISCFYFAQPRNNYPVAKLLGVVYHNGWSQEFLVLGAIGALVLAVISLLVIAIDKAQTEGKARDRFMLFSFLFSIFMAVLNIYHLLHVFYF